MLFELFLLSCGTIPTMIIFSKWCRTVVTQPYMLTFQKQDHDKPQDEHQSEKPAGNI
jgi:hypothetical protein